MDQKMLKETEDVLAKVMTAKNLFKQFNVMTGPSHKEAAMKNFEKYLEEVSDAADVLLTKVIEEQHQTTMDKLVRWMKTH